MEEEDMNGQMQEYMMGNGKKINYTAKDCIFGLMAEAMKGIILMIKRKGLVSINGQMVEDMKALGKTGNKMVKLFLLIRKENKEQVYGKMVPELNGLIKMKVKI
jgi:hypothetical protein